MPHAPCPPRPGQWTSKDATAVADLEARAIDGPWTQCGTRTAPPCCLGASQTCRPCTCLVNSRWGRKQAHPPPSPSWPSSPSAVTSLTRIGMIGHHTLPRSSLPPSVQSTRPRRSPPRPAKQTCSTFKRLMIDRTTAAMLAHVMMCESCHNAHIRHAIA